MKTNSVLIACRAKAGGEAIRQLLEGQPDLDVSLAVVEQGHADPLHAQRGLPDILVLLVEDSADDMLRALGARSQNERPPTIVIAPAGDANLMRRSMQIGARDYFSPPVQKDELLNALKEIRRDFGVLIPEPAGARGSLIAVINAKGGSGASTIAANLAHLQALESQADVALVDLDLQFGTLPLAFDITPHHSLLDTLHDIGRLDAKTLRTHAVRHKSGVSIFSAMSEQMALPWEQSAQSLRQFLDLARRAYGTVFVDLPRQIDPLTTVALEQADRVLIVMQQSLAHIRDTKRLLRILSSGIAVPSANVTVVVNRYVENTTLGRKEITDAISPPQLLELPNDFKTVSEAQNVGVPLHELDKNSPMTKGLSNLLTQLMQPPGETPQNAPKKRGLRALFGGN
ncbi:AAA family ATPase [Fontimonas sp. SYSU GA230001]|uniref:AAA family ATPase n=1 Tax=Fontimonas sp. SYSU GA230001 TaxID=3142450 RepID=UPI0032B4953F